MKECQGDRSEAQAPSEVTWEAGERVGSTDSSDVGMGISHFSCSVPPAPQQEVTVTASFVTGIETKRWKINFTMQLFPFK